MGKQELVDPLRRLVEDLRAWAVGKGEGDLARLSMRQLDMLLAAAECHAAAQSASDQAAQRHEHSADCWTSMSNGPMCGQADWRDAAQPAHAPTCCIPRCVCPTGEPRWAGSPHCTCGHDEATLAAQPASPGARLPLLPHELEPPDPCCGCAQCRTASPGAHPLFDELYCLAHSHANRLDEALCSLKFQRAQASPGAEERLMLAVESIQAEAVVLDKAQYRVDGRLIRELVRAKNALTALQPPKENE